MMQAERPIVGVLKVASLDEFYNYIDEELTKRGQLKPEYVNSIEECTDTTKLYVLPDGYVYGYMMTEKAVGGYTNQIPISTDESGNIYNGKGYKDGYRFNSSNNEAANTGTFITGFIPVKVGDTVRLNGNYIDADNSLAASIGHLFFKSDKTMIGNRSDMASSEITGRNYSALEVNADGYVTSFTLNKEWTYFDDWAELGYIRLNLLGSGEGCIVTVNEEIVEGQVVKEYGWANTGHAFVPADYEDRIITLEDAKSEMQNDITEIEGDINNLTERINDVESGKPTALPDYWEVYLTDKIAAIKALQKDGGKDCFSFVLMADTHYSANLGKRSPSIAKKIMDECSIKFALHAGDWQTRGCHKTKESLLAENEAIDACLAPIRNRLLMGQGNHDGSYGLLDRDGDGTYNNSGKGLQERESYVHNLTPEELHEFAYRKVGMVGNVHFDETGTAYYIDDTSNNARYIGLNTQCNDYELQDDGTQAYPKMWLMRFTQPQFDFLINEALVEGVTSKTKIVIFAHVPTTQEIGDRDVMNGVLKAFVNKSTYSGNYAGEYGYDAVSVNVDFTDAKGTLVGYFHGHTHVDSLNTANGFNIIGTRCDAAEENDATLKAERVTGTVTEQSFDVFTVNTKTRTINATKIGAGSDREISY